LRLAPETPTSTRKIKRRGSSSLYIYMFAG